MRQRQIGHGIHIISAHFCAPRQSGMRTCGFDQNQVSPQAIYPCSQRPLRGALNHGIIPADMRQGGTGSHHLLLQLCLHLGIFIQHGLRLVLKRQARAHNGLPQLRRIGVTQRYR